MDPTGVASELRNRKPSPTEEFPLDDLYGNADFDFNLNGVHSDVGNMFQRFAKKEIIKAALKKQVQKAESSVEKQKEKIKRVIKANKTKLEEKIHAPPFLRTSDKFAFTVGLIVLCLTEFLLLKKPGLMPIWYTLLIFPLLIARYYFYHKAKYHYFMLDFCYYVQVLLLAEIYIVPSPDLFQILFALSNGPLCVAIVMWRNSLVFHDLDKITSVAIHIFPPLVTFSLRWYPPNGDFSLVCTEPNCSLSPYYAITLAMVFYAIWQALYLVKTEVFDKEKLENDCEIMTSVKWMTQVKPHPIYKIMLKKGMAPNPVAALTGVQAIYTMLTLIPIIPIFQHFELHCIYLSLIFIVCIWNGANYYFEIFTETYTDRLQRFLKDAKDAKALKKAQKSSKEDVSKSEQPTTVSESSAPKVPEKTLESCSSSVEKPVVVMDQPRLAAC